MATQNAKDQVKQIVDYLNEIGIPAHRGDGVPVSLVDRVREAAEAVAEPDKLLTSHEAGALLQMDPSTIVKWVNDGILPAYRTPGKHRRIRVAELVAFLHRYGMFVPAELKAKS